MTSFIAKGFGQLVGHIDSQTLSVPNTTEGRAILKDWFLDFGIEIYLNRKYEDGAGDGYGSRYDGYGAWFGTGRGDGDGYGDGAGFGWGNGYGDGIGYGDGWGDGYGAG